MKDDIAAMTSRTDVAIPARSEVVFEPGGLHIMLVDVTEPLTPETRAPVALTFEHAGTVEVTVVVQPLAEHLRQRSEASSAAADHSMRH